MGKKNKNHPDIDEILARPWCYYCERDFDDLKILISHQKAKHFKCERCGRRLNTAGGLNVHMSQVHKESLMVVDNALAGRSGLDVEIFGMEGIPDEVKAAHENKLRSQFQQAEAARRSNANNTPAAAGGAAKKPRMETSEDIKRRLAEHKARMEAAKAGGRSQSGTPGPSTGGEASPAQTDSPATYGAQQHPAYSPPAPGAYAEAYPNPYGQMAPGMPVPQQAAYQQYGYPQQMYHGYPGYHQPGAYPQQTYGAPYQQYPVPQNVQGSLPPRPDLPAGLPQRPPSVPALAPQPTQGNGTPGYSNGLAPNQPYAAPQSFSVPSTGDLEAKTADLVVKSPSDAPVPAAPPTRDSPATPAAENIEKKAKKDKTVRLIYSDDTLSPEEKRALLPRYAFAPNGNDATGTV